MGTSQYDPAAQERRAWNAGKKVGAKRALKPRQVWAIRFFLDREADCVIGRCSILPSIASFVGAISSRLRSAPW